jgi:hypothetical protein
LLVSSLVTELRLSERRPLIYQRSPPSRIHTSNIAGRGSCDRPSVRGLVQWFADIWYPHPIRNLQIMLGDFILGGAYSMASLESVDQDAFILRCDAMAASDTFVAPFFHWFCPFG